MRSRTFIILTLLFVLAVLQVRAQALTDITPEMRAAANDAFQKHDWEAAIKAYEKIIAAEGKNAGARYRLGMSMLGAKRNVDAVRHLEMAMTLSPNPVFALALARAYARSANEEKMYETLEASLKLGGIQATDLNKEADFASYRSAQKFLAFVDRSDKTINPCKASPEFRQFDFWIGEWLPRNPQGVTVGTSSVQLILGSCVIFENWETPVSSGKSFNIYDTRDGKWHQTWVDAKGLITHYAGGIIDGKMVLTSETVTTGKKTLNRMTFSKIDESNVRQHGESSIDSGQTWTTTFDLLYVRAKQKL